MPTPGESIGKSTGNVTILPTETAIQATNGCIPVYSGALNGNPSNQIIGFLLANRAAFIASITTIGGRQVAPFTNHNGDPVNIGSVGLYTNIGTRRSFYVIRPESMDLMNIAQSVSGFISKDDGIRMYSEWVETGFAGQAKRQDDYFTLYMNTVFYIN